MAAARSAQGYPSTHQGDELAAQPDGGGPDLRASGAVRCSRWAGQPPCSRARRLPGDRQEGGLPRPRTVQGMPLDRHILRVVALQWTQNWFV